MARKWASRAFDEAKEGSLKRLGWPDGGKLVEAARRDRKLVVGKLLPLANASADLATRAKAKSIIARIKRELGES
jgi:hypothetical protein